MRLIINHANAWRHLRGFWLVDIIVKSLLAMHILCGHYFVFLHFYLLVLSIIHHIHFSVFSCYT